MTRLSRFHDGKVKIKHGLSCCENILNDSLRFKSRYDFGPADIRFYIPRMSDENFLQLVDKFRIVADKYGVSTGQLTLAWIIAEHPDVIPIPGSRTIARLEENAKTAEIALAPEDVNALRASVDAADVKGAAWPEEMVKWIFLDSVPLSEYKGEPA